MRRAFTITLIGLLGATSAAAAPPPPPVRVDVIATSQAPKSEGWRALANRGKWCSDKGVFEGQGLEIRFDVAQPLTMMEIVSGTHMGPKGKHTDPTRLELFVGKKRMEVNVVPGDITRIKLDGTAVDAVQFEVFEVAPGKTKKTCVEGIRFLSGTDRYLNVMPGIDAAALEDLPSAAVALDAALKACDAAVLATAVKYPVKHDHMRPTDDMGWELAKKTTYKTAKDLVKACTKKGSYIARGSADPEQPVAEYWTYAEMDSPTEVRIPHGDTADWTFVRKGDRWLLSALTTATPME